MRREREEGVNKVEQLEIQRNLNSGHEGAGAKSQPPVRNKHKHKHKHTTARLMAAAPAAAAAAAPAPAATAAYELYRGSSCVLVLTRPHRRPRAPRLARR